MKNLVSILIALGLSLTITTAAQKQDSSAPALKQPSTRDAQRTSALIADEVRHQLVMMPYYGVFDWLEADIQPNGAVTLRGQITRPTTKSDAEARVRKLESVSRVNNDAIRIAVYRALFNYNSSLFRYATLAVPPIHIIVKNGRVALKGFVANEMDKQLAYTAARNVSGVFEVTNELKVDGENY
jgi:hyperosmotically inducible protein